MSTLSVEFTGNELGGVLPTTIELNPKTIEVNIRNTPSSCDEERVESPLRLPGRPISLSGCPAYLSGVGANRQARQPRRQAHQAQSQAGPPLMTPAERRARAPLSQLRRTSPSG